MKKLSLLLVLFLCVFVCISAAHAIPIIFKATGIMENNGECCNFDWDGLPFTLIATIDSGKEPYLIADDITKYKLDSSVFSAGGSPIHGRAGIDAELGMLTGSLPWDMQDRLFISHIGKTCYGYSECEYIETQYGVTFSIPFPHGQLGPHPVPIPTALDSTDGIGDGYHWPGPDPDDTCYDLRNVSIVSRQVPEPATMLLLGSGLVGLAGFRRKKFKK